MARGVIPEIEMGSENPIGVLVVIFPSGVFRTITPGWAVCGIIIRISYAPTLVISVMPSAPGKSMLVTLSRLVPMKRSSPPRMAGEGPKTFKAMSPALIWLVSKSSPSSQEERVTPNTRRHISSNADQLYVFFFIIQYFFSQLLSRNYTNVVDANLRRTCRTFHTTMVNKEGQSAKITGTCSTNVFTRMIVFKVLKRNHDGHPAIGSKGTFIFPWRPQSTRNTCIGNVTVGFAGFPGGKDHLQGIGRPAVKHIHLKLQQSGRWVDVEQISFGSPIGRTPQIKGKIILVPIAQVTRDSA